jgi:hypothetical protein
VTRPTGTARCVRGCTIRARHLDGCDVPDCPGCLPAMAAPGLAVCERDADRTHGALSGPQSLAGLWVDVEDGMTLRARYGGAGGSGKPLPVDLDAAGWRQRVRACLVGWLLILEEDFGTVLERPRREVHGG